MLSSSLVVCGSKTPRFIKEQEANGFLTGLLWVKSPFERIPILGIIIERYKINEIVKKFLLNVINAFTKAQIYLPCLRTIH